MGELIRLWVWEVVCGLGLWLCCAQHVCLGKDGAQRDVLYAECAAWENKRGFALAARDPQGIELAAREYLNSCRSVREREAIALAMAEVAYANWLRGRSVRALQESHACLVFFYRGVQCHAEKARALTALRERGEASEAVRTGYLVAQEAEASIRSEIRNWERSLPRPTEGGLAGRLELARWKLGLVAEGRARLAAVEDELRGGRGFASSSARR